MYCTLYSSSIVSCVTQTVDSENKIENLDSLIRKKFWHELVSSCIGSNCPRSNFAPRVFFTNAHAYTVGRCQDEEKTRDLKVSSYYCRFSIIDSCAAFALKNFRMCF
jgi:hypothetical protein